MRDLDVRLPRRVQGRDAIEQALRRLLIRVTRFGEHRARTAGDRLWACRVADEIKALLDVRKAGPTSTQFEVRDV